MHDRSLPKRVWYRVVKVGVNLAGSIAYHIRYTGAENVPLEGGVLLVSNHQSHLDPALVGAGCPRMINVLARQTLYRFAPFGWLIDSIGSIPIDREGGGLAGIKDTLRHLKRGHIVLMFPEGTRTPDGEVAPFRPGFTALPVRAQAAIVPVAIEGAFDAWPRWRTFPGLGTIHVHYGPAILPEQLERYDQEGLLEEVEARVRRCCALLRQRPVFARRGASLRRR